MALSLNQIVERIRTLSLSHRQINDFFFGDPHEFDANGDITYPGCFLEILPGGIDRVEKLKRFNFRIFFLDLVKVSDDTEGNEQEVLSDMDQVASDMLALLMNPVYQNDWVITEQSPITAVTEVLGDMAAGVSIEIEIGVEFLADSCQVPADDVEFEQTFNMARTKIVSYDATGSEGESWTISDLNGKNVIAAFRSGYYKRIKTTTPDTEEIQLAGVDLGSFKGIVTTGVITLAPGDAPILDEKFDFLIHD